MSPAAVAPELHPGQVTNAEGLGLWRVFRSGITGWRLVWAPTEERAAKKVASSTHARPVRPSSWHQQQKAAGLAPKAQASRRKGKR